MCWGPECRRVELAAVAASAHWAGAVKGPDPRPVLLQVTTGGEWTDGGALIRHLVYIDDWVLPTPPEAAAPMLGHITRALAELALPLQRAKCAYMFPRRQAAAQEA